MEQQRIQAIREAATLLFLRQGYAKTQISHIAQAVGVSVGTIYHDFAGKQEIMHFVLKCTIDPQFATREFARPLTDDLFQGLEEEISAVLQSTAADFCARLDQLDDYPFATLIADAYDLLARYAVGCLFIEKNESDVKRLAASYRDYRRQFFATMCQYLEGYMAKGLLRPLPQAELTATLIIEILTWWAMDRRYISYEAPDIPHHLAKAVCLDNILHAYQLETGPSGPSD